MFTKLKRVFANTCPQCQDILLFTTDAICSTKYCPHGHYKEETYGSLGVKFVYDEEK